MFKLNKYLITLIAFSISPHDALGGETLGYLLTEDSTFTQRWEPAPQTGPTEEKPPLENVLDLLTRKPVTFGENKDEYIFETQVYPGCLNMVTLAYPQAAESSNPTVNACQRTPVTTPETIKFIAAEGKLLSETQKESNIINDAVWALLASVNKKRPSCWIHTTHGPFHISFQPASPDSTISIFKKKETITCESQSFHDKYAR